MKEGSQSEAEQLALDVYVKLHRALNAVQARSNRYFVRHGLTPSQFATLEVLYHKGRMCQKEIAEKILRSGGNLTVVIDNLEKRGFVSRTVSQEDRRENVVDLTDSGRRIIASIFPDHARGITAMFSVLSSKEQLQLGRLCRRLGKAAVSETV